MSAVLSRSRPLSNRTRTPSSDAKKCGTRCPVGSPLQRRNCQLILPPLDSIPMKRYLRFCLVFLISLALPLSGMAGAQALVEPCPMKTMGMSMMGDMGKDCCQDMSTASEHGKPCKPGQECKTGGMLQVSIAKPGVNLFSPVVVTSFVSVLPVQTPSGVWRPPRV